MKDISTEILNIAHIAKEAALIQFLNNCIAEANNTAQEYIQDCDNEAAAEREFGKAEAYKEVLEWLWQNHKQQ